MFVEGNRKSSRPKGKKGKSLVFCHTKTVAVFVYIFLDLYICNFETKMGSNCPFYFGVSFHLIICCIHFSISKVYLQLPIYS